MAYVLVVLAIMFLFSFLANVYFVKKILQGLARIAKTQEYDMLTQSDIAFIESILMEEEDMEEEEEDFVRVAIDTNANIAYWISPTGLMYTEVEDDGFHDYKNGKIVDTLSMSDQEIALILEIVDALKGEEHDEGSGSGE